MGKRNGNKAWIPLEHRAVLPSVAIPENIEWFGPKIHMRPGILTPAETMYEDRLLVIMGKHRQKCLTPRGTMARPFLYAHFTFGPQSPPHKIMGNLQDAMDTIAAGLNDLLDGKDMRNYENKLLDRAAEKASRSIDVAPGLIFNGNGQ